MIEIINGGMLSTVQDAGRFGVMKNGFTQSGAMDSHSMKTVNVLCGNDLSAPVIEMTMLGITAKFTDSHIFCLSKIKSASILLALFYNKSASS